MLSEPDNRRLIAAFRLLAHREDSLAWATLLHLTHGIGDAFVNYVYERARTDRTQFGAALLAAQAEDFDGAPGAAARLANELIEATSEWLDPIEVPAADEDKDWGAWIIATAGTGPVPAPSEDLAELLVALDENAEAEQELARYLGQIWPLGQDRALAESAGVRIMTMGGAKGLTVRATVIAALEDQIIPRQEPPLDEERRLLYVALTRAREYVFGTWARRRTGPTARVGGGAAITRRSLTRFLRDGPVESQDGAGFLRGRW
jgi:ATP-dependent DNA helicase UvrD/PcrA